MKKEDCKGCYNDDYNNGLGGAKECWHFDEKQELVDKLVIHVDARPPYDKNDTQKIPPCYTKQRYVCVKPEALDSNGRWR